MISKIENEIDNCDLRMQSGTVQQLKELKLKKWGQKIKGKLTKKIRWLPLGVLNRAHQERYPEEGLQRDKKNLHRI